MNGVPVKRGRGRPRKIRLDDAASTSDTTAVDNNEQGTPTADSGKEDSVGNVATPKKRGRPPKKSRTESETNDADDEKRTRVLV